MKQCTFCEIKKSDSCFYYSDKKTGKLHSECKQCYNIKRQFYWEEHYAKYGDAYRDNARERKAAIKRDRQDKLYNYLSDKECEDCGINDIRCLEFDHINPKLKEFEIARAITTGYSWDKILKEINKCRLLCANCHKIITAEQQNWRKWRLGGVVTRRSAKSQRPVQFR